MKQDLDFVEQTAKAEVTDEDLLFISWGDEPTTHGLEIGHGVILRLTDNNQVAGVTIYDVSRLTRRAKAKLQKPEPPRNLVLGEGQQPPASLAHAAKSLYKLLELQKWLVAVGQNDGNIIVYATSVTAALRILRSTPQWQGWPITVRKASRWCQYVRNQTLHR